MAYKHQRAKLSQVSSETRDTNRVIVAETPGASFRSTRFEKSSPLLRRTGPRATIKVRNVDTFTAGLDLLGPDRQNHGRVACLNMACAEEPAGAWLDGSMGQEEMLCSRSTLFATLNPAHYPITGTSCIWSPDVVVYKRELDPISYEMAEYPSLGDRFLLGVISVAAIFQPECTSDLSSFVNRGDQDLLEDRIRLILRVLGRQGQARLVLGALGCGAFRNPPAIVARTFKRVLAEEEWLGYFEEIVFAVLDRPGGPNVTVFDAILSTDRTTDPLGDSS